MTNDTEKNERKEKKKRKNPGAVFCRFLGTVLLVAMILNMSAVDGAEACLDTIFIQLSAEVWTPRYRRGSPCIYS